MRRPAAIAALLAGLPACPLAALQCPDGAPPPCRSAARAPAAPPANSIAVLTFDNLSHDTADAYLVEGLANDISAQLGRLERLSVASRTMVRRLSAETMTPQAIGRTLNTTWLVNGGVQRGTGRVRVSVELVRATTGQSVWSDQYDRSTIDLLDIQRDVATAVASEVAGRLSPQERRQVATSTGTGREGYDHLLRGDYLLAKRSRQSIEQAIAEYESAARSDPRSSRALASVGSAYNTCSDWQYPCLGLTRDSLDARATRAVDRALRIDSLDPNVLHARSSLIYDHNLAEGLRFIDRAIALSPRDAGYHHQRGWILAEMLRDDDALAAYRRTLALDPARAITWEHIARVLVIQRRYGEALAALDSALTVDPDIQVARFRRALLRAWTGDSAGARADLAVVTARAADAERSLALRSLQLFLEAGGADSARVGRSADSLWSGGARLEFLEWALYRTGRANVVLASMPPDWAIDPFWARYPMFDPVRNDPRFLAAIERARRRQNPS